MSVIRDAVLPAIGAAAGLKVSDLRNPALWLQDALVGRRTDSGEAVSPQTSLGLSAYYACIRNLSEDLGKLPFLVYRRLTPRGKARAQEHPAWALLRDQPNPEMSPMTFVETLTGWALGWGGGFAEIVRDGAGNARQMWPIHPARVWPERRAGRLIYRVKVPVDRLARPIDGALFREEIIEQEDMFHLHGLGSNGITGYSIAQIGAQSIGIGLAAERFSASFFGNGTHIGLLFEHPETLSPKARKNLEDSLADRSGAAEAFTALILEEGMKVAEQRMGIAPKDAQLIEAMKFSVEQVARWFRMQPHKIQHLDKATNNNIEHQGLEYVIDTASSWAVRWEQEVRRKLIGIGDKEHFAEILLTGLLRGDQAARGAFYRELFNLGALSPNDIREIENLNPIDEEAADRYYLQVNLAPLGSPAAPSAPGTTNRPAAAALVAPAQKPDLATVAAELRPILLEACERVARRESLAAARVDGKAVADVAAWAEGFYPEQSRLAGEAILPWAKALNSIAALPFDQATRVVAQARKSAENQAREASFAAVRGDVAHVAAKGWAVARAADRAAEIERAAILAAGRN